MREPLFTPASPLAKVNVVPIIDVSLVLVVILLFTAPILSVPNAPLNLPVARALGKGEPLSVCVTLTAAGETSIDERPVAPDRLEGELRQRLAGVQDQDVLVVVRADASLRHGAVRRVLDEVRGAGAKRVAVATRQAEVASP